MALDGGLTVSDVDSGGNLTGATVTIGAGFLAGDTLNFTNQNGISGSYNAATGVLTLTGTATRRQLPGGAGIDHLQLHRAAIRPAAAPIPPHHQLDGDRRLDQRHQHAGDQHADHGACRADRDRRRDRDLHGGGAAVALDGGLDGQRRRQRRQAAGATVSIGTGFIAGDTLNFTTQNGITGSYNAATGVLTLSGTATRGATIRRRSNSITYSFTDQRRSDRGGGDTPHHQLGGQRRRASNGSARRRPARSTRCTSRRS